MNDANDVLDGYRRLHCQMLSMVQHAQAHDWDALVRVQYDYVTGMDRLAANEHRIQLDPAGLQTKQALIAQIRAAEQTVREQLTDRMAQLSELMQQAQQDRRVKRAYAASMSG